MTQIFSLPCLTKLRTLDGVLVLPCRKSGPEGQRFHGQSLRRAELAVNRGMYSGGFIVRSFRIRGDVLDKICATHQDYLWDILVQTP